MFERMSFIETGERQPELDTLDVVLQKDWPQRIGAVLRQLQEMPAAFEMALEAWDTEPLVLEWQSVFESVGVAYFSSGGLCVGACLLLGGKFAAADRAAIDAIQSTLAERTDYRVKTPFDALRRSKHRPLRATIAVRKLTEEQRRSIQLWGECIAAAYFEHSASPATQASELIQIASSVGQ